MKVTVSRNELLAALLFASSDGSRYVLNSVCIEAQPGKKPCLISTDGRRLSVIETVAEQSEPVKESAMMLVNREFITPICALSSALSGRKLPWIQFESKPDSKQIKATLIGADFVLEGGKDALVDGNYPAWRQIVPKKGDAQPGSEIGFNSNFISDYLKAGKLLHQKTSSVRMSIPTKGGPMEIRLPGADNFYGILMQVRLEDQIDYQPEFLGLPTEQPKEQAA